MCCNVYYDKAKPIGDIRTQSLEEIFCANYAWRKILFLYSDKPKPCKTCRDSSFCHEDSAMQRQEIIDRLEANDK
ncbi:SPASM domain-containing protein [Helicobacter aurati]|uniref:SPASM domain-containing protein n=1 Tax=Helicobacter aurati TaxID=137778 RepID=UPI0013154F3E|nr:SPASM domain-containing protein [Helicobacter aurati]